MTQIIITVHLELSEALALAQHTKRIGFSDCRKLSVNDDEAYLQMDAITKIQKQLAEAGVAPR